MLAFFSPMLKTLALDD